MDVGQPSLDQLRVFLAVVDEGSFNRAATKAWPGDLGRQLRCRPTRGAARRPTVRARGIAPPGSDRGGQALIAERARGDRRDRRGVAKVRGLHRGLEAELALAVDVMVEPRVVAMVLREFQQAFPTVDLRLHVEALGAVAALVLDRRADLALAGTGHRRPCRSSSKAWWARWKWCRSPRRSHPLARMETIAPGRRRANISNWC